jgi:hypothetical protein
MECFSFWIILVRQYKAVLELIFDSYCLEVSRVQTRLKPSDFSSEKILSTPSFRGEVKPSVPCRALRHVKEHKSDVEVATFGKILGRSSPIVPPSAAGFASVASGAGGLLWRNLERSKSLVLLQVGGLTCRWQRHSVKPSCWECSTTVEQAEPHLRVVVPTEEEEGRLLRSNRLSVKIEVAIPTEPKVPLDYFM